MTNEGIRNGLVKFLAVLMTLLLLAAGVWMWLQWRAAAAPAEAVALAQPAALAQRIAADASAALAGDADAFGRLRALRGRIDVPLDTAALTPGARSTANRAWGSISAGIGKVLDAEAAATASVTGLAGVQNAMPQLLTGMQDFAALLPPAQVASVKPQLDQFASAGRALVQDLEAWSAGDGDDAGLAEVLRANDAQLANALRDLAGEGEVPGVLVGAGLPARTKLQDLRGLRAEIGAQISAALESAAELSEARGAAVNLAQAGEQLFGLLPTRAAAQASQSWWQKLPGWTPLALLAGSLLSWLGVALAYRGGASSRLAMEQQAAQSRRNQDAILRVLDELGSLADGDLTVRATVTEDITGAIADSINYAIEALRGLVTTIDETAEQTAKAAHQTQVAARHLAQASENQSRQVFAATESIANMANSIEEVSGNAERSADVARHAVGIADKGNEAVRRTIDGMNTIRETIQETSKRIKRLGESSQEIGDIVELINDIAEQTNILALNASIQASMAGESGRGFAVVADEVQRLAERSANATKQIEVLVKTIQADTNEAVVSMERSTTDVVSGATLAENAGSALEEIEKVSHQIAGLVQNISQTARQQATEAADVTRNMGVLQEISSQTADNTSATSRSIGKLAELALAMRKSVDGFKLPEVEAPAEKPDTPEPVSNVVRTLDEAVNE